MAAVSNFKPAFRPSHYQAGWEIPAEFFGLQCWFCHRKLRITIWHRLWTSRLVASLWPTIIYIPLTSITTNFEMLRNSYNNRTVFLCLNLKLNYINIYSLLTCWGQTRTMRNKFNEDSSFLPDPPPTISQSMAPKISCFWIVNVVQNRSKMLYFFQIVSTRCFYNS